MNPVTSASSIGAPSAGVRSGSVAGAPSAQGPSFGDVFQQLSGGDMGIAETNGGTAVAQADGSGDGMESVAEPTEASASTAPALSADDAPAVMGSTPVPVAFVLPVPPPPSSEASGGTTVNESESVGRAGQSRPKRSAGSISGTETGTGRVDAAVPLVDAEGGSATETAGESSAGSAPGPDSEFADTFRGAPGLPDRPADRSRPRGDGAARELDITTSDGHRATATTLAAAVASPSALSSSTAPAPAAAPSLDTGIAPTLTPATTHAAAIVMAHLLGEPANDAGRVLERPNTLAQPTEPSPAHRWPEVGADAALAALTDSTSDLSALDPWSGVAAPATTPIVAAMRGQSALSAALRAFQQAGAPASGDTPTIATSTTPSLTGALVDADRSPERTNVQRQFGFAAAVAETLAPAAEPDRRMLAVPAVVTAPMGGELRLGADMSLGPRVDVAGMPGGASDGAEPVHAQIVQSLRVQWAGGAGEARVRLRPEYLGDVVATIKVEQGTVTATLQADTPEVRRWMEANTQSLREGLVEHGLKLDRLVVLSEPARGESADGRQGRPRGRQPQSPPPRDRRPRQQDEHTTFSLDT